MTTNNLINFSQRKIRKNYRSITGHFPSVKNNKSIGFESKLEKALFLALEFDNTVLCYQEQPQIKIFFNGKNQIYSADCYIKKVKNTTYSDALVEVKYTSELEKNKEYLENKFKAITIETKKLGLKFEIFTEKIYSDTYLYNLDFLYRFKLNPLSNKYENKILQALKDNSLTAYDIAQKITHNPIEYSLVANSIWNLVTKEVLTADLYYQELTMNSIIKVAHE